MGYWSCPVDRVARCNSGRARTRVPYAEWIVEAKKVKKFCTSWEVGTAEEQAELCQSLPDAEKKPDIISCLLALSGTGRARKESRHKARNGAEKVCKSFARPGCSGTETAQKGLCQVSDCRQKKGADYSSMLSRVGMVSACHSPVSLSQC